MFNVDPKITRLASGFIKLEYEGHRTIFFRPLLVGAMYLSPPSKFTPLAGSWCIHVYYGGRKHRLDFSTHEEALQFCNLITSLSPSIKS